MLLLTVIFPEIHGARNLASSKKQSSGFHLCCSHPECIKTKRFNLTFWSLYLISKISDSPNWPGCLCGVCEEWDFTLPEPEYRRYFQTFCFHKRNSKCFQKTPMLHCLPWKHRSR